MLSGTAAPPQIKPPALIPIVNTGPVLVTTPPAGMFFALPVQIQAQPLPFLVSTPITKEESKKKGDVAIATSTAIKTSSTQRNDNKKTKKASSSSSKPAPLPAPNKIPGTKYLFPKHHTTLHVIHQLQTWDVSATAITTTRQKSSPSSPTACNFRYRVYHVGTSKPVDELIEDLLVLLPPQRDSRSISKSKSKSKPSSSSSSTTVAAGCENDSKSKSDPKSWALTEVIEKGDGVFERDLTVRYVDVDVGNPARRKVVSDLGWDQSRGVARPPVWLVLHLV